MGDTFLLVESRSFLGERNFQAEYFFFPDDPRNTDIRMETQPFEDASAIKNGDFPLSC